MTELEALEDAIEILLVLQYSVSPFLEDMECSECTCEEQDANGCCLGQRPIKYMGEPLYIPQVDKEYFNCPISLIPPVIYSMMDKYNRVKEFNQTLDDDTSYLYWWFTKTYNRIKSDIVSKMREKKPVKK